MALTEDPLTTGIILSILLPLCLGTALLRAIGLGPRSDPVAFAGWAWIAGALGTAALEFVALASGLGTGKPFLLGGIVLACAAFLFLLGRRVPILAAPPRETVAPAERIVFAAALALALIATGRLVLLSSLNAIIATDEALFWSYRAKMLFTSDGFGPSYRAALAARTMPHADYPLLDPLLQLWTFLWAGRITHVVNRLPIQLVALSLVLCSAAALRRVARPALAALALLLLPATAEFSFAARHGYADVLVAAGLLVLLDGYLRWRAEGDPTWIRLASMAGAFALWAKHDALLYACALLGASLLARLDRRPAYAGALRPGRVHLALLAPLGVVLVTWISNAVFSQGSKLVVGGGAVRDPIASGLGDLRERLPLVLERLWALAVDPSGSHYLWPAFLVLFLAAPLRVWRGSLRLPALALLLSLAGLTALFCWIPDFEWHLRTAAPRLLFQLFPALLLWIGALGGELLRSSRLEREARALPGLRPRDGSVTRAELPASGPLS